MAIAFVTGQGLNGANVTSASGTITLGATSDFALACVGWGAAATRTVTWASTTYSAAAFTQVASALAEATDGTARHGVDLGRKVAPATGANTMAITMSAVCALLVYGIESFSGVDSTTPLGTAVGKTGTGTAITAGTVTSDATEIVAGVCNTANTTTDADLTPTDTQAFEASNHAAFDNCVNASRKTGSASTNLAWTGAVGTGPWSATNVPVKPTAGAATVTYPQLERFGHRGAFRGMLH
jgi:hypothetical protein